jgi:hypothetical protein
MAWALQFDGVNDYVTIPLFDIPSGATLTYTYIPNHGGANEYLLDTTSGTRPYVFVGGGNISFNSSAISVTLDGSSISSGSTAPVNGSQHVLVLTFLVSTKISSIGARFNFANPADMQLLSLSVNTGADTLYLDATASSHASGTPVLTDTIGANNATGVNMPTDGSAWVDLGGGGISLTALLNSNYMIEYNMKKNVASQSIGAQMITISDGSNFTGSVAVEVTIDGGAKTTGGGSVTHEGEGYHSYALTQAETNGNHIAVSFAGTGALTQTIQVYTSFPQTVDNDTKISLIPTTAMRGTDSANTVVPPSVAQFNARTIVSADYFLVTDYTAPDNASITSILADTNELQTNQGNWLTATGFSTSAEIAALNDISVTDILTTQMTESYAGDGTAPTLAQSLFLTMQNLQDFSYAGTTQTVKRLDGSTTAATYTLNDAVTPTSKTRAS